MAADILDLVETIRTEEASRSKLFGGEGRRLDRSIENRDPGYIAKLAEAGRIYKAALKGGKRDRLNLEEAMTTSDFPGLFGDILSRQLLGAYDEFQTNYQAWTRVATVSDFRSAKMFAVDGAEGVLDEVPEDTEYKAGAVFDKYDTLAVKKYGRRLKRSLETFINDDLDALRRMPQSLAKAGRRTEQKLATSLYVDANGPHASLYTTPFANKVTGNPVLTLAALQTAWTQLLSMKDFDGEPIIMDAVTLVVPPALKIVAENIINAIQIEMVEAGGTANQKLIARNWIASGGLRLELDPYIPIVASSANGNTSWFLFGDPNAGRAAIVLAKLRGYEQPVLFEKIPNSRVIGGGDDIVDFETDASELKVRHVLGGSRLTTTGGYKTTVASNGSGS